MSVETASEGYYSHSFQNSSTTLVDTNIINVKADKSDDELSDFLQQLRLENPDFKILPHAPAHKTINEQLISHITNINNETCLPGEENSFFVGDLSELDNLYKNWKLQLPRIQPFYAVKCNPNPIILKRLAKYGVNFDCASKLEIETILNLGVDPSRIIYANPCKMSSFIRFANDKKVLKSTFDNVEELYKIKKFHPNSELFLRITTDDSTAQCRLSTKYGADLENVRDLVAKCKELELNLCGVSFHVGSGANDFSTLYKATRDARWVFDLVENEFNMPALKVLDVGGGFQLESFKEASYVLNMALDEFFPVGCNIDIIAEPGRYFVASTFTLATNVIAKRKINNEESMIYINDGVYGNMNCILFDHQEPVPRTLYHNDEFHYFDNETTCQRASKNHLYKVSIWGPTCDGLDCITKEYYMKHDLVVGDWLFFQDLGAYTSSAATAFNGFEQAATIIFINENGEVVEE
ncbi:similar to Saccharomyces cerevisiae YKL184W SPE1 Ornithine decarboxylase, catalyzes the first step in polyamine biosynthesis [Maudiozyma barnettii]|nr:similar to Saccharomyces cerevisiae YKL184W SPE1 Ornithine decarboxylase, catalyzes the first step in polyamine biosynthesis [Kazachstania barnettii]